MSEQRTAARPPVLPEYLRALRKPQWVPRILGWLVYLIGLVNIFTSVFRGSRQRVAAFHDLLPGFVTTTASAATVIAGVLLLFIGHGLVKRKRRAWVAAVALLAANAALHVMSGILLKIHLPGTHPAVGRQFFAAGLSLILLAVLLRFKNQFQAWGDPRTRWVALRAFIFLFVLSMVVGLIVLSMARKQMVGGMPDPFMGSLQVLLGLVGLSGPIQFQSETAKDVVETIMLGLGLNLAAVTLYLALRLPQPEPDLSPADEEKLRGLLDLHPDSLGYFNLRRDKSVVFSESEKAAIAYRVVSGVILASGDPIGDPEAWPGAIHKFLAEAERHAWTPAVLGCSEKAGKIWTRETGFDALEMGDEAVVDTESFSLSGRPMRNVRQMVNRIQRAGYSTEVYRCAEMSDEQRQELEQHAAAWRGSEVERGYSMSLGRTADPSDPDALLVLARKDDAIRGFLQFVPWGTDGMSLDLMRFDRDAESGISDLMIVSALTAAKERGIKRVSLNFAFLRSTIERGERLGAGPVARLTYKVLKFADRWFQIERLYKFNSKYQPEWQPRFVIFPNQRSLPRVGLASAKAEAFIAWPSLQFLQKDKV